MANGNDQAAVTLPEGKYAEYLATEAGNIADRRIQAREQKWRALQGAVVGVLAIMGFVNLSSIEENLSAKIDLQVQKKLPDEVATFVTANRDRILGESFKQIKDEVTSRIAFMQLYNVSVELDQGQGFSRDQRDAAVGLIRSVADNREIVESPEFSAPLQKILGAFLRADQSLVIDELESLLASRIAKSQDATLSMVQHYGMRITGASSIDAETRETFEKYARIAAEAFKTPEAPAPFQLAIDFKSSKNQKTERGLAILKDVSYLSKSEKADFLTFLDALRLGTFYQTKTGEIERIELLFAAVHDVYKSEIDQIRSAVSDGQDPAADLQSKLLEMLKDAEGTPSVEHK